MSCMLLCAHASLATSGASPRVDSDGQPVCELCGRRLSRVKHQHRHGLGHACHPRCKARARPAVDGAAPATAAAASATPRKRRAQSDPGELPAHSAAPTLTRRVTPPQPTSTTKKQYNTRREEQIMRMLDETHARRMAAEEAAAAAAAAGERGTTHTGFTLAFVP